MESGGEGCSEVEWRCWGGDAFAGGCVGVWTTKRRGRGSSRVDALIRVMIVPLPLSLIVDAGLSRRGGDVDGSNLEAMEWWTSSLADGVSSLACSSLAREFPSHLVQLAMGNGGRRGCFK